MEKIDTPVTRRTAMTTVAAVAGAGAFMSLPVEDLLAGQTVRFTPLRLNNGGQRQVNPTVTRLDNAEDDLIDDLLNNNAAGEQRDLGNMDNAINGLIQGGGQQPGMVGEAQGLDNQIRGILRGNNFGWGVVGGLIRGVDSFVGHWFPCNDLLEISTCEQKIWAGLHGGQNQRMLYMYSLHMMYEMRAMFQFHGSQVGSGAFGQQANGILNLCNTCCSDIRNRRFMACRGNFARLTTVTSLFCRRHYPRWC